MNRDEIREAVSEYIKNDRIKYAVMIDGAWGSGKTYLYKKHLAYDINSIEGGKKQRKTSIYISLYGISTIEELAKEVLAQFIVYSKWRGNKLTEKRFKVADGILAVIAKAVSFSNGSITFGLNGIIDGLKKLSNLKDMVICFDDMERCAISIGELFGFINNLVEHCNTKVIIIADENNIGKIYANTNVENKYQTILSGNRKVIDNQRTDSIIYGGQPKTAVADTEDITIDELKKLNERLYSENYIYQDVKEKIIGKTFYYYPSVKEIIKELINGYEGAEANTSLFTKNKTYQKFLNEHIEEIEMGFREVDNSNLRIIINWMVAFEDVYLYTKEGFENEEHYEYILKEFIRYSIWVAVSVGKNKKLTISQNYGSREFVYLGEHEYRTIRKYSFIDAWIKRDVKDKGDLYRAATGIIDRRNKELAENPEERVSAGKKMNELKEWYYMSDIQVNNTIESLMEELKNDKYAYSDYLTILDLLLKLNNIGLFDRISDVQQIMMDVIEGDNQVQQEDPYNKPLINTDDETLNKLYEPIKEKRMERNKVLEKNNQLERNIFDSADDFFSHCKTKEGYYLSHRSFTEYVNVDDIFSLVKRSSLEGIYKIRRALDKVYYMGNARDFYSADIPDLLRLRKMINNPEMIEIKGKTHKYAIDILSQQLTEILVRLGYKK